MATATALHYPHAAPAGSGTFSLVADAAAALRVLQNLSGFGRRSWIDRLGSPRAASRHVELTAADGETITVEVSGAGRPLVLVHGLGGSHHDWDAAVELLAATHRVYTLDLGGHGARAAARRQPTLETMARDIALVIERLSLERPLLVGHSLGALVVMQYLKAHGSDRLAGVCFVDQSPRITTDAQWQLGLFGSLTRARLQAALARGHRLVAHFRHVLGITPLLSIVDSLVDSDFRDVVAQLTLPALVVLGGASHHYGGLPLADYYRATLAGATVTTYPASAHSPHRQQPARFATDLAAFAARCA